MADSATDEFRALAGSVIDELLSWEPVAATWLGDHRFDASLPDFTSAHLGRCRTRIEDRLAALDAIDDLDLDPEDGVDLEILRAQLSRIHFEITELRATTWNPMLWNPGTALHLLLIRDFAPIDLRAESLRARLAAIPGFLAAAKAELGVMPRIHVETAIAQLAGTLALIEGQVAEVARDESLVRAAATSVIGFTEWLTEQLPDAERSPRLGSHLYSAVLWHSLDDGMTPEALLEQAERSLDEIGARMRVAAGEYLDESPESQGVVERALARVASEAPVTDSTVLEIVEDATARSLAFVREHDLVSIPETEVRIIEMPEIHRGVAVAYCDAPGPLESADAATFVAVSPTPADWSAERTLSFYREYNAVQLHDLTIHEAFPGHVLQLAHARQFTGSTNVRRLGMSGVFVEGWAVYAEELMLDRGYSPDGSDEMGLALRLQQLKMQARMTINAILDIRVHSGDLDEPEAIDLMLTRGYQEEGEAVGKWRRALLTAGQLPTYFTGYLAVRSIVNDLRVLHPDWTDRALHDFVLSQGSPAPRHLRALLGI
ncbi:MAG: DUF885 family protein [Actinobacteria bacterium]|uniref:Unannotated protein n=1 Tax=freshwater metagenome TaxID=449393 RepID=A0A6J7HI18_9ZZZZ|nr:DUF885 family protein [Actinomycetota bacterium]